MGCWPAPHWEPPPAAEPPPPWAGLAAAGCSRGPGRLALAPAQTCCWPVGERSVIGGGGPLAHGPRRRWLQSAVSSYHDSTSPEQHIKSRRRTQQRKHIAAAHPYRGVLIDDAPQAGKVLPQPRIVPHVAAAAGVAAGVGVKRLQAGGVAECGSQSTGVAPATVMLTLFEGTTHRWHSNQRLFYKAGGDRGQCRPTWKLPISTNSEGGCSSWLKPAVGLDWERASKWRQLQGLSGSQSCTCPPTRAPAEQSTHPQRRCAGGPGFRGGPATHPTAAPLGPPNATPASTASCTENMEHKLWCGGSGRLRHTR